jgi:serine/threonine-protein kinase RIM15
VSTRWYSVGGKDDTMAGNITDASQFLAPPTVAALREEARNPSHHRVAMDHSFSEDMRAEREDLREAAEETLNVILDLGLDGHIKWVSPSWRQVVGTDPESVEGKVISDVLWSNKSCFQDAITSMKEDDSRSRFIRFSVVMGPASMLKSSIKESSSTIKDDDSHREGESETPADDEKNEQSANIKEENDEDILDMEAQGIMIYDRSGDGEGHVSHGFEPLLHIESN